VPAYAEATFSAICGLVLLRGVSDGGHITELALVIRSFTYESLLTVARSRVMFNASP
jgi:hypothetical protein